MKLYKLKRTTVLPISIEEAWGFFSSPHNLSKITPPHLNFRIISIDGASAYAGQLIEYKLNLLPGFTSRWVTEIAQVRPPYYFVDTQVLGPYTLWHHQHHFRETESGTEMVDIVHYAIPFGLFGRLVNKLYVAGAVRKIFEYRQQVLSRIFEGPLAEVSPAA